MQIQYVDYMNNMLRLDYLSVLLSPDSNGIPILTYDWLLYSCADIFVLQYTICRKQYESRTIHRSSMIYSLGLFHLYKLYEEKTQHMKISVISLIFGHKKKQKKTKNGTASNINKIPRRPISQEIKKICIVWN